MGWLPAVPCHAGLGKQRVFGKTCKFSLQTEDGKVHRFLMTWCGMAWLVSSALAEMSPRLAFFARWWARRQVQKGFQYEMSSGIPSNDGSPKDGHVE
jgi:hypothetical protein